MNFKENEKAILDKTEGGKEVTILKREGKYTYIRSDFEKVSLITPVLTSRLTWK